MTAETPEREVRAWAEASGIQPGPGVLVPSPCLPQMLCALQDPPGILGDHREGGRSQGSFSLTPCILHPEVPAPLMGAALQTWVYLCFCKLRVGPADYTSPHLVNCAQASLIILTPECPLSPARPLLTRAQSNLSSSPSSCDFRVHERTDHLLSQVQGHGTVSQREVKESHP